MDDSIEVSTLLRKYNNAAYHDFKNNTIDKNLKRAKNVSLPSVMGFKSEFYKKDGTELVKLHPEKKEKLQFVLARESQRKLISEVKGPGEGEGFDLVIKLHAFNAWSSFITSIAYYTVEEIYKISDSDILRLSPQEMLAILQIITISKRHSQRTICNFIQKWSKPIH